MNLFLVYSIGIVLTFTLLQGKVVYDYVKYCKNGGLFPEDRIKSVTKSTGVYWVLALAWPLTLIILVLLGINDLTEKIAINIAKKLGG